MNTERIADTAQLDELLSVPSAQLVAMMKRLDGDLMILGIAGKMGVTMGRLALRAIREAGVAKRVIGVARFTHPEEREKLRAWGVETIGCDLLDREAVRQLPRVRNVIFMAGRKFGTEGNEAQTWAMNTLAPAYVAEHFRDSRIVAFSTGCVYPLVGAASGGCTEETAPAPVGEYAQSCLGRERIFEYHAVKYGTRLLLFRLNYSVDLRYGVLHDIARRIREGQPVENSVGYFNVIWQGDANTCALRALELADSPPAILNVTGPEIASVEETAGELGRLMGKPVAFTGKAGDRCYLNDASRMCRIFGAPQVSLAQMIRWQAEWIANGGESIGKPTHFEVSDGKF